MTLESYITEDTHVYAWWTPVDYKISVSVDSKEHGKVVLEKTSGHYVERIVPGVEPDPGYEIGSFKIINDSDASIVKEWTWGEYTGNMGYPGIGFTMPAGDVTVYATFKEKEYTVNPVESAPISRSHYFAAPGETVTMTPWYSSQFLSVDELFVENLETGEKTDITEKLSFIMPAANAGFDAKWHYTDDYYKNVFVSTDGNGSAFASTDRAEDGEIVTLTATPNKGYGFKEWQVYLAETGVPANEETLSFLDLHDDRFRYDADGNRLLLRAVFEELPTCTVTFDAGGKKGKMKALSIPGGESYTLPECGFYPGFDECQEFDKWDLGEPGESVVVTSDLTYYFKVRALDETKALIGSVSAVLKTGTLTKAPAISKLTSPASGKAKVTYGKVSGAKSYLIYVSANGKKWTKKGSTAKTAVTLSKLPGGKKLYVKVIAVNNYGANSAPSPVKTVTVKK